MPSGDGLAVPVGYEPADVTPFWSSCAVVARVDNAAGVLNGKWHAPVTVCRRRLLAWPLLWRRLAHDS